MGPTSWRGGFTATVNTDSVLCDCFMCCYEERKYLTTFSILVPSMELRIIIFAMKRLVDEKMESSKAGRFLNGKKYALTRNYG